MRKPVACFTISEQRRDEYLRNGFRPLNPDDDTAAHKAEWRSVLQRLSEALSRHGTDGIGDGDYYLDTDEVPDRFLFVELTQESMLGPSLLTTVHQVVAACPVPYSVDICGSNVFLKTRSGEPYPGFNIFVEKDRILVFSEAVTLLKVLGIPDAPALPDDAN